MKLRNPCKECDYFHPENGTCQSKRVSTMGTGKISIMDRLFCEPYKEEEWNYERNKTNRDELS